MKSAATIHTATGLFCRVKERFPGKTDLPPLQDPNLKAPPPDEKEGTAEPALVRRVACYALIEQKQLVGPSARWVEPMLHLTAADQESFMNNQPGPIFR